MLVLSLALSLLLASLLTKMILRPVNEAARQLEGMLTPGEYTEIKTYRELEPFIGKIREMCIRDRCCRRRSSTSR